MMQPSDYIGLDIGEKRTGIARASTIAKLAEPLKIVPTEELMPELAKIIQTGPVAGIVVGLPRSLNGDDTAQTKWVRDWAEKAKEDIDLPFFFQDEALTTKMAETDSRQTSHLDDRAASIILQDFLDSSEQGAE